MQTDSSETMESCRSAKESGVHAIVMDGSPVAYKVFCEMKSFGGGWTVIQQRFDGSVDFNRSWAEYRDGFGTVGNSTEFWLGLEAIHQLTGKDHPHELLIELKDEQGKYGYGRYKNFKLSEEDRGYNIAGKLLSYKGTIGDSFSNNVYLKFRTFDRNLDFYCGPTCVPGFWSHFSNHV